MESIFILHIRSNWGAVFKLPLFFKVSHHTPSVPGLVEWRTTSKNRHQIRPAKFTYQAKRVNRKRQPMTFQAWHAFRPSNIWHESLLPSTRNPLRQIARNNPSWLINIHIRGKNRESNPIVMGWPVTAAVSVQNGVPSNVSISYDVVRKTCRWNPETTNRYSSMCSQD